MKSRNNFYTLIARVFKKQVRHVIGRCCKNFYSHFASKNVEKGMSTIRRSYETAASSSTVREMPVDPVNSFLGMIRFMFASRLGTRLHEYVDQRHKDLGPIYRSHVGSTSAVFIKSPEEYRKIFVQLEGPTPKHFIPEAWIIYNNEHSKVSRGLFFMYEIFCFNHFFSTYKGVSTESVILSEKSSKCHAKFTWNLLESVRISGNSARISTKIIITWEWCKFRNHLLS